MRSIRNALSLAIVGALICVMSVSAFAANTNDVLDLSKTGSITINMEDETDGELSIYKVADLAQNEKTGEYEYVYTAEFADCNEDMNEFSTELTTALTEWIETNNIEASAIKNINDGYVEFNDLELGMYFVIQNSSSTGYVNINSFLVTIPMEDDGTYVYEVNATPKVKTIPHDSTPDEIISDDVIETVLNDTTIEDTVTKVPSTSTTTTTSKTPFSTIIKSTTPSTSGESKSAISSVLDKLPQTGQLTWPIIAAMFAGVILIGVGVVTLKKKNNSEIEGKNVSTDV